MRVNVHSNNGQAILRPGLATDDKHFSNYGSASDGYSRSPDTNGVDPAVTHIRIDPKGMIAATSSFAPTFRVRVRWAACPPAPSPIGPGRPMLRTTPRRPKELRNACQKAKGRFSTTSHATPQGPGPTQVLQVLFRGIVLAEATLGNRRPV